jgi:hypothetical protein
MLMGIISVPLRRNQPLRRYGQNFGENNGLAKLTEDEVIQIKRLALAGAFSQRQIARVFGITQSNVCWIKHGRTWRHLWQDDELKA